MTHAQPPWQPDTTGRPRPAAARAPAAQPDRVNGSMAGPRPAASATARGYRASQPPDQVRPGPGIEESQLPDLQLYERLIDDGIAAADARGSAVNHVTARRLAICLAARPQVTGLRPQPGPLRPHRGRQPRAEDPAAHPRPLRHLR